MNQKLGIILLLSILLFSCNTTTNQGNSYWDNCNFDRATERTQTFVKAINDQNPKLIYRMLTEEYRNQITKEEFINRYLDDLTYPYISPLYCYLQKIDLHYDVNGSVSCKVASRLIGEKFSFNIYYENGDYYFKVFEDIIDNSYRDKFENKVIKWI